MLVTLLAPAAPLAASGEVLRGAWRLDREGSDDLVAIFEATLDDNPMDRELPDGAGPAPAVEGGSASTVNPRLSSDPPAMYDPESVRSRLEDLAEGIETLSIAFEKPLLVIREADGTERAVRLDGTTRKSGVPEGRLVTRAKWDRRGRLVITTNSDFGFRMIERWTLAPDAGRLQIVNDIYSVMGLPHLTVQRVYERVVEGEDTTDEGSAGPEP